MCDASTAGCKGTRLTNILEQLVDKRSTQKMTCHGSTAEHVRVWTHDIQAPESISLSTPLFTKKTAAFLELITRKFSFF